MGIMVFAQVADQKQAGGGGSRGKMPRDSLEFP